jgi:hypothetical protein
MGAAGSAAVAARFTTERMVDELEVLYDRLVR